MNLSLLVILPFIFAALIASPVIPNSPVFVRRLAKWFAGFLLAYSLGFLYLFESEITGYQFEQTLNCPFLQSLGANFSVGLDGISLVLVLLTTFLFLMALLISKSHIHKSTKLYYSLCLVLEGAVLGVFCAKDLVLFLMFWELELIPMYLLIRIFGSGKNEYSAMKFLLYTFFGSMFMMAGIIALAYFYYKSTGTLSFDIESLKNASELFMPAIVQAFIFIGFFTGFAVKLPIVPLHTWLPDVHVDAPTPISMILAGVLLKMGAYGLIRFNIGFFPDVFDIVSPVIIILGVINMLYAAVIAFAQTDFKKLIAYSSISHMGLVLIGLGALSITAVSGSVLQLVAHGITSAALFMITGAIYNRTKTREIALLGGLQAKMPTASYFALIFFLASLGLPLLIGFVAELLVFIGAFSADLTSIMKTCIIIGLACMILTASYLLIAYRKVFQGNLLPKYDNLQDLTPHELIVVICLVIPVIAFGIFPNTILHIFENTVKTLFAVI